VDRTTAICTDGVTPTSPTSSSPGRSETEDRDDNNSEIKGPIATYDGGAYFGSWDHNVYRVNLEDGTEDWSFQTGNLVMSGPALDPELDTVFIGSHDGNLYALDAQSGERHWSFETDLAITGCPTRLRPAGARRLEGHDALRARETHR